jgi:hypothetical protein
MSAIPLVLAMAVSIATLTVSPTAARRLRVITCRDYEQQRKNVEE